MRFLIYDQNEKDLKELRELVGSLSVDFVVDGIVDSKHFLELFEEHTYDVVFIDLSDESSRDIISYIQSEKPEQRLAILSSRHECVNNKKKCKVCKNDYNIKRIAKPFRHTDFFFVLENSRCAFDFDEKYTASILLDITKRFRVFEVDTQTLQIRYKEYYNISRDIIELCEELKANNIEYKVTKDHYIQVMDKAV